MWEVRKIIDSSMELVDLGETSSKKTFYTVRSQLLSQVKSYLSSHHDSGLQRLQNVLDSESWEEVIIPRKYQKLVDKGFITVMFGSNGMNSPPAADIYEKLSSPALSEFSALQKLNALKSVWWDSSEFDSAIKISNDLPNVERKSDPTSILDGSSFLIVDDEKFKLTSALLSLFDLITFYIECAILLDYLAPEALSRLVQAITAFHVRSKQLILGAIGMQASSMKQQISSKQITMSSQCLGILISSIPIMISALKDKLPPKHHRAFKEFDRLQKDLVDHREDLFSKLKTSSSSPPFNKKP